MAITTEPRRASMQPSASALPPWASAPAVPLGIWAFGKAEAYAKRTGKLKRVG